MSQLLQKKIHSKDILKGIKWETEMKIIFFKGIKVDEMFYKN